MKKLICLVLSILLLLNISAPCFASETEEIYPTIIVAGYSSPSLYLVTPEGNEQVWGVNADDIIEIVLKHIAEIGIGLGELAFGNADYISNLVGSAILELYGVLAYDESGKSVNNIVTYPKEASKTQFSYLLEYENGEQMHEPEIMASVAAEYDKLGVTGYDWIFSFQHDFRQNITDSAKDLDKFIDSVLEFTGKDKVNLYAVSHGGEVCSVYLSMFGTEKCAVNNCVLTVPAIGGAALAYDLISENITFDEETLLYFIENGTMSEADYDWLVRANQLGILDDICRNLMHSYIKKDLLGYWGSIWDFIPAEYYDELKEECLDSEASAELIAKSDYYHYEILPVMSQSLNKCMDAGINVYIVAGTDIPSVTGLQEQSDGIITVNSSTGSYTAPYGQRFADGYVQKNTVCKDTTHNHISPAMTVDASCAYLPENTWFVDGLFHGMTWKDDYTVSLCLELLFSKENINIYTYEAYPQFKYSTNRCYSVVGRFNTSAEGYLSADDSSLIVTNLSYKYPMKIESVYCAGAELKFDNSFFNYLKPQESTSINFSGKLPEKGITTVDITINYTLYGNVPPYGSRTLTFTYLSADKAEYDSDIPFVDALHITEFEKILTDEDTVKVLEKTGLFDWFKMIFNSIYAFIYSFVKK